MAKKAPAAKKQAKSPVAGPTVMVEAKPRAKKAAAKEKSLSAIPANPDATVPSFGAALAQPKNTALAKPLMGQIEVVEVSTIQPSTYNPRKVFPERLELVKLSLQKLGFLLPIYVDENGEILSGHQRHYVATEMLGAKYVPVVRTRALSPLDRRKINLLFNRSTNDMTVTTTSEPMTALLERSGVREMAADLPDLDVNDHSAFMPILDAEPHNVVELLDANPIWRDISAITMAINTAKTGGTELMPIVITDETKRIVNGRARCAAAGRLEQETIPAVTIREELHDLASSLLNLLSMKYEVEGTMAEDFRSQAFAAAPSVRHTLSVNACAELISGRNRRCFDHLNPVHAAAWVRHYGPNTLDFGAGNYWDAMHAEQMGANVAAFEPYFAWDRLKSRAMAEEWFFSRISDGRPFNSIFLSNVVNTIPFEADRIKVALILAALSGPETRLYSSGIPIAAATSQRRTQTDRTSIAAAGNSLTVDGESGLIVTNITSLPLIQKHHTKNTLAVLWSWAYNSVEMSETNSHVFCRASDPKPVDPQLLTEAIEFEFNLPWRDGSRYGMVDRAIEVFSGRLDIDLAAFRTSE